MVGVLMAAGPAGVVVGTFLLGGFVAHERRLRLMRPLAVAASAALIGCLMQPALAVTLVLWFCAGLGMSYQLAANAAFVSVVPAPSGPGPSASPSTGFTSAKTWRSSLAGLRISSSVPRPLLVWPAG